MRCRIFLAFIYIFICLTSSESLAGKVYRDSVDIRNDYQDAVFLQKVDKLAPLDSQYIEIGYHKSKLRDGFLRVHSVYSPDLNWDEMKVYAESKRWTGIGSQTVVYFFDDKGMTPDVTIRGIDFSREYFDHWIAGYWHKSNGDTMFEQQPTESSIYNGY